MVHSLKAKQRFHLCLFACLLGLALDFLWDWGWGEGVQKEQRKTGQQRGAKSHFLHRFDYLLCASIFLPHVFLGHLMTQPDLSWCCLARVNTGSLRWRQLSLLCFPCIPLSILRFKVAFPRNWEMSLCARRQGFGFFIDEEILKRTEVEGKQGREGMSPRMEEMKSRVRICWKLKVVKLS